ncbi:MAG TPA: N-acetyltransferase [Terracidiphilus sp.]|nr:N-acetyltransferase [Terracidiphilus sp.]
MRYRLYSPEDFPALYAIEEVCFEPPFRFSRRYLRAIIHSAHSATWLADVGERIVGFSVIEWSIEAEGALAYLQTIEVLPEFRKHGVASELLGCSENSALAGGAHEIWLHVDEFNASAIRLYEYHGYVRRARKENYYPQGRAALVLAKQMKPVAV